MTSPFMCMTSHLKKELVVSTVRTSYVDNSWLLFAGKNLIATGPVTSLRLEQQLGLSSQRVGCLILHQC